MCRLFGLTAGEQRVAATFWLLDAQDSLRQQSRGNPDGTGLGTFDADGRPLVEKQPLAAFDDPAFGTEARERRSATFVAHVRHSSGSALRDVNTHPFQQDGRIFAHNGVVEGLPRIDRELGDDRALVLGDTDSERVFALITREIRRSGGDVGAGVTAAVRWIADSVPVFALNCVLTTPHGLWAWRYPDTHELWVLDRRQPQQRLEHRSHEGTRVASEELADLPSVVIASERMDDDPGWRLVEPDVLISLGPDLVVQEQTLVGRPPRHPLTMSDLGAAAASQADH